jgi:MarR family transcriptional regulator, negative regulator of the multidrug operon emrRAB
VSDRLTNLLGVVALAANTRMEQAVAKNVVHGGSGPSALVHVAAHPGGRLEELRRVLGISQPATVRLVDRLIVEGLLERRPGADRRSRALRLTDTGERAAAGVLERRTASLRALLEVLEPDEQAALEPLLERLVAALADDARTAFHVCRLCDRAACADGPGCPLDHAVRSDP